ncbi:hypothetical protein RvY_05840 [Ramazzottius varieornatus]|uniref:Uncharacterized protein n=1 Tax=Ramazzottius varieornatus TaxID=947166 RepID=A0A1D1UWY4_RAMVA|nr:hypothetical protein RvY_05840 [Ramazzottius varieornatus]
MKNKRFGREKKKHGHKPVEKEVRHAALDQTADLPSGRISDGLLYPNDIEIIYKRNANGSLVPYEIKSPIVPEETQNLIYRLKQPKKPLVLDEIPVFVPDPEADHDLRYAQQAAVQGKISHIFEGNKKVREADM